MPEFRLESYFSRWKGIETSRDEYDKLANDVEEAVYEALRQLGIVNITGVSCSVWED